MRLISNIITGLFGTAQRVTAQLIIAVPTSLCVAYVTQVALPVPAPVEAKVEAAAPLPDKTERMASVATVTAGGERTPLRAAAATAADRKGVVMTASCGEGCGEIATPGAIGLTEDVPALAGTPLEADFDPALPNKPGLFVRMVGASRSTVDAAVARLGHFR